MSRTPANAKRYPIGPLAEAMGESIYRACMKLGVSGSVQKKYRAEGITDQTAELLATRAGFHPFEIWPELADDRYVAIQRPCAECGELFDPTSARHIYCSTLCKGRVHARRYTKRMYAESEAFRAARLEAARVQYASESEAAKRARNNRRLARYRADPERFRAQARARYARNRDAIAARRAERRKAS